MKDCHWGPVQISGSYKAENIAEATEDRQLWFPAANCLFWLQLQTHRMKASLSGNIYNSVTRKGVSGGAFHGAAEVNLHLVSWSQRLPPDVPCLLQGQPILGAQRAGAQAREELILISPDSLLVFTWYTWWSPRGRTQNGVLPVFPMTQGLSLHSHCYSWPLLLPKHAGFPWGWFYVELKRKAEQTSLLTTTDFLIFTTLGQW